MSTTIALLSCQSYEPALVQEKVRQAVDSLGGIRAFIKPGCRVLVKPNLLMAKDPEAGITTHPEVVRAVVKLLKEIDCTIFLGDGPSVWGEVAQKIAEVYETTGMQRVAREEGVELVSFDKRSWRGVFPLTTWLEKVDCWVNIPKFKTHDLTTLTGALKNSYGLVSGTYKVELHKRYFDAVDFAKVVVDIHEAAQPQLTVIDGVLAMEGSGPGTSGKRRWAKVLCAGKDCVAVDAVLAKIMGVEPRSVPMIKEAAARSLGVADLRQITITGESIEQVAKTPFLLPATSFKKKLPRPLVELAKGLIRYYPFIIQGRCTKCGTCVSACPQRVISLRNGSTTIDRKKCISCFCCKESCPAAAIELRKSLFTKLAGL